MPRWPSLPADRTLRAADGFGLGGVIVPMPAGPLPQLHLIRIEFVR